MRKLITLLTIQLLIFSTLNAQDWKNIDFPINENITGIFFVHPDTGFAITNTGKFARTFDKGSTWDITDITKGTPLEDIHFTNSKTGFVCGHNGAIYSTQDGGYNWNNESIDSKVARLFDIQMFDDKTGLAIGLANEGENKWLGIRYRTTNGGKSWIKEKSEGLGFSEIYQEKESPAYYLSFGKIHTSINKGKNWTTTQTHNGGPARTLSFHKRFGILAGPSGIVYYTNNGGASWYPSQQDEKKIFVSSQMISETVAYIGGIQTPVMISIDGGKSWTDELLSKSFDVLDFFLIGTRLYACGSNGGLAYKIAK